VSVVISVYVHFDVRSRRNLLNAGMEMAVCFLGFCFCLFVFVLMVMLLLFGVSCRLFTLSLYLDIFASRIDAEAAMGLVSR